VTAASVLSPAIRILEGGSPRLLAGIGTLNPESLAAARELGGYAGLTNALSEGAEWLLGEVDAAGLRGRGGAGYPTAAKWRAARAAEGARKVVVANLMGADPTSLGDRALAEGNPHLIVEGVVLAAFAVGASEGIIAVRRDWTDAVERLERAVAEATEAQLAGYLVGGSEFSVQLSVHQGSGAYVAGEETALLAALAGDRGMPLIRPPYPATRGLGGAPTVIQNGETLAHVAWIAAHGAKAFRVVGTESSPGTKLVSIAGAVRQAGVAEVAMGTSLAELIKLAGGSRGTAKAAFVGGPGAGALRADEFKSTTYDFESLAAAGAHIGSGSVLIADNATCMVATARFLLDFSAREACGKAVPCRIGTKRLVEALDRVLAATPRPRDFALLRELSAKVADTSLCRLESLAPRPMLTTLDRWEDEYRAHAERGICPAGACAGDAVVPLLTPLSA
jgi:NADH:ubiquinone oxidoreductase subunit F (NADH-binding)